jgi:PAS domain-containing protein
MVRQLRIPLQAGIEPRAGGQLAEWAHAVRTSPQACLLTGIDGALIALSEEARRLLGPTARPGLPHAHWWQERFPHSSTPEREQSLLSRTAASGAPAHSVIQLLLGEKAAMVQVIIAPLEDDIGVAEALLVFIRPVHEVATSR